MVMGQFIDQCLGTVFCQQHLADGSYDTDLKVWRVAQLEKRIEVILLGQGVAHGAVFTAQSHPTDGPVQRLALIEECFGIDGLMGSMKATNADVSNAMPGLTWHEARRADRGCQLCKILAIEFHASVSRHGPVEPREFS